MYEDRIYSTNLFYHIILICTFFSCVDIYGIRPQSRRAIKNSKERGEKVVSIGVSSSAFEHEGTIPSKYTCDGEDMSPPLKFTDVPANTKSIVLICDDPDAPKGTWVHWVVIDLPGDTKNLPENVLIADYSGAIEGMNSWGKTGYGGACPPSGIHRYYFKVYALDTKLGLTSKATKEDVLKKIEANNKKHLLGYGELMGRYSRTK